MIYLHKILPLLFSPLAIAYVVIVYGTVTSRKKVVIATVAALYLLSTPVASKYLFGLIEGPPFRQDPATMPNADAIVVLSGMLVGVPSAKGIVYEWSDPDRFFAGIELFKLAKSPKLIFTGGKLPWNSQTETEGAVLTGVAESMGIPSAHILLTDDVKNTEEEAKAVRKLLSGPNPSVLLVTSAFHMQRSVRLFESQHLKVIPYPVDFHVEIRDTTPMDFLPNADSLALTSLALREQIGRTFYWLKSRI
ncbi:MAG: YdcF family protein [Burkholderiaceae bacterium]|nr:YdcF family protein [Burkholderiaceae bacterium]